jgi:4-alpha-glucanotransferase
MRRAGILSCRILYFERDAAGAYRRPRQYPQLAAASVSSHDLPPLKGYWQARDIDWRERIGLQPAVGQARQQREAEKAGLLSLLRRERLISEGSAGSSKDLREAVHRLIARSASAVVLIQLEDLIEAAEQMNLPGTTTEHPNWRRRLHRRVEDIFADLEIKRVLHAVRNERARSRVARDL